jgi:DNA-directed RNA polymerase specialized sigma24 family protein
VRFPALIFQSEFGFVSAGRDTLQLKFIPEKPTMEPDDDFRALLERVGHDDEEAAAELVRRYEPVIRTMVRTWLRPWESKLRKIFDSNDICQSVLAWFFLKNATQRYDLSSPDNLCSLLRIMVRNRVHYRVRQSKKASQVQSFAAEPTSTGVSPEDAIAEKEFLETVFRKFSPEEADLARRRMHGASWDEISSDVGGTPDARRMQLARAATRLAQELALPN